MYRPTHVEQQTPRDIALFGKPTEVLLHQDQTFRELEDILHGYGEHIMTMRNIGGQRRFPIEVSLSVYDSTKGERRPKWMKLNHVGIDAIEYAIANKFAKSQQTHNASPTIRRFLNFAKKVEVETGGKVYFTGRAIDLNNYVDSSESVILDGVYAEDLPKFLKETQQRVKRFAHKSDIFGLEDNSFSIWWD